MAAIDILKQILAKRKRPDETVSRQEQVAGGAFPGGVPQQPDQTMTLGGTESVPIGSPMAARPRIVPGQPAMEVAPPDARPVMNDDARMADSLMATRPGMTAQQPSIDYSDPRQRAKAIENKDYSIIKDAEGNVTHRGVDRDKKWSLGEKIGSAIMGMFDGTGAVNAAMDRNYMEKRQDKRDLADAYGSIQRQQAVEKGYLANQQQALNNEWMAVRPEIEQQKVEIAGQKATDTAEAKRRDFELKERTQGWKETDRVEYYRLEREKLEALKENRADQYELAVRRQTEIERNNKVNNDLRGRQVAVSEGRAQIAARKVSEGGTSRTGKAKVTAIDPKKVQGWFDFAKQLDDKFNNGEIDKTQYDNMVVLMEHRMAQESR